MNPKEILAEIFYRPQRFAASLLDEPAVILIYHRVAELQKDPQLLAVKPDNFYEQVQYLKKNYNLLTVEEFDYLINKNKKFPAGSLLISFDDGYADNANAALPILESLGAQALFFVTTSNLNTSEEMWWDKLDQVFFSEKELKTNLPIQINGKEFSFDLPDNEQKLRAYGLLHRLIKFNKKEIRDDILKRLFEWAEIEPVNRENYRMMRHDELLRMAHSKSVVIGAHTHTHTPLSILDFKEQVEDIKKSKKILEELTGQNIKYFSYPFGNHKDYNSSSVEACRQLGFNFVCSNFYFQVHSWTSKYELPRALVRDWEFEYFKTQIKRFFRY